MLEINASQKNNEENKKLTAHVDHFWNSNDFSAASNVLDLLTSMLNDKIFCI